MERLHILMNEAKEELSQEADRRTKDKIKYLLSEIKDKVIRMDEMHAQVVDLKKRLGDIKVEKPY